MVQFTMEGFSDATGGLRIELPPYETFFAIVSYDDFRPISYTGFSGDGTFALPAGTLALRPDSEFQDISEWSAMCEGSIEGYSGEGDFETVMVDGDIRLNISEQDPMSLPTLEGTILHLISESGQEYAACYGSIEVASEEGEGDVGFGYEHLQMLKGCSLLVRFLQVDMPYMWKKNMSKVMLFL